MSQELILPFTDDLFRLPACRGIHSQLRSNLNQLTSNDYAELMQKLCQTNQSRVCGIVRQRQSEKDILALAFYRIHPTTFDTIRFELHDLVVDEAERNRGLGTRLLQYLIDQAKQHGAPSLVLQCDLTNVNAHRFFFRHGLIISSFGFYLNRIALLQNNDQIEVLDITDFDVKENEQWLIKSQEVFRQLRPHLSADRDEFIKQIRNVCQTGPARLLIAKNNEGKVLGLAVYRLSNTIKYSAHIYCDDLVTDENQRSSGVGRALINGMKNEGNKLGLNRIALDSGCQRGRAHRFYHREGFDIDQFEFSIFF